MGDSLSNVDPALRISVAEIATPVVIAVVEFYLIKIVARNWRRDKEPWIAAKRGCQGRGKWPVSQIDRLGLNIVELGGLV
jgi:hypothetical protein